MNARRAFFMDDCFARFDQAFAQLEADLIAGDHRSQEPKDPTRPLQPHADLSEYEEAFSKIDRELAASPASQEAPVPAPAPAASPAPAPVPAAAAATTGAPRPNLALVPPAIAASEPVRGAALALLEVEELWQRPAGTATPLERLVTTVQNLLWLQRAIQSRNARMADRVRWEAVAEVVRDARQVCIEFDLPTARVRAEFALTALEDDHLDHLSLEIVQLIRHIRHDLQTCAIWPIARDRAWAFNLALGDAANAAFPSAVKEVTEAGRCAGFGVQSAAMFHLVRAADAGRRALAQALRPGRDLEEPPDWAQTVALLHAQLKALTTWPAGPARKRAKDYFTALIGDCRTIDDTARRVAAGDAFEERHVLAVWYTTRDLLARLAERVSESGPSRLASTDFIPEASAIPRT